MSWVLSLADALTIVAGWELIGYLGRRFRGTKRIEIPREKNDDRTIFQGDKD